MTKFEGLAKIKRGVEEILVEAELVERLESCGSSRNWVMRCCF
jgi:hypothetical protein